MSERWIDSFSLKGRLSRAGMSRLQRRFMLLASIGVAGSIFLGMAGVPTTIAVASGALVVLAFFLALGAAYARRVHDIGRHARQESLRWLLTLCLVVGPAASALLMPDLPARAGNTLLVISGVALVMAIVMQCHRGSAVWKTGDDGPNEFGPPPLR